MVLFPIRRIALALFLPLSVVFLQQLAKSDLPRCPEPLPIVCPNPWRAISESVVEFVFKLVITPALVNTTRNGI
jgi:hypothetical protein